MPFYKQLVCVDTIAELTIFELNITKGFHFFSKSTDISSN